MRVFAVNSSPRTGSNSKTQILLECLIDGLTSSGADVDVVNLREKKINNCVGCFTCWTKTPGECVMRDDMALELLSKYLDCDLCVLATPLYHYTLNAQMKAFIERTLPIIDPLFVHRDGVTAHETRIPIPKTVVLSVAAFPETDVFEHLQSYVRFLFRESLISELYRTSSEMLRKTSSNQTINDVLAATREAGIELASSGTVSKSTKERVEQPITDFSSMAPLANLAWRNCMKQKVTPAEFRKRRMRLRPDSIESFLAMMKLGFREKKAVGAKAGFQFHFFEDVEGSCFLLVDNGVLETGVGEIENPDLMVRAPFHLWMDVLSRKIDAYSAIQQNSVTLKGNPAILEKLGQLFR